MKRIFPLLLFAALAISTSASAAWLHMVGGVAIMGQTSTFYISTAGTDASGCGTIGSPCASPNGVASHHSLVCGSTIIAAAGTYSQANMTITGAVSCPGQNDVVMVKCTTAFACSGTTQIKIESSYWGVAGWTMTSASQACFLAEPPNGTTKIGVIAWVNNIASTCSQGGIVSFNNNAVGGAGGVGSMVAIGNIIYNAATTTTGCDTGITNGSPIPFIVSGDENYDAWNFAYGNITGGSSCNSGGNSDQTGLNIDTDDNYTGTQVFENNWSGWNGGPGIEFTTGDGLKNAGPIIARYNTLVNNMQFANLVPSVASELLAGAPGVGGLQMFVEHNVAQGNSTLVGSGGAFVNGIKFGPNDVTPTSVFDANFTFESNTGCGVSGCGSRYGSAVNSLCLNGATFTGVVGYNVGCQASTPGGLNSFTVSPNLISTTEPGAPSCAGKSDTLTCFATQIANLQSRASGSTSWGAQTPAPTDAYNSTPFLCHIYQEMPATMLASGGGPIPVRCSVLYLTDPVNGQILTDPVNGQKLLPQ